MFCVGRLAFEGEADGRGIEGLLCAFGRAVDGERDVGCGIVVFILHAVSRTLWQLQLRDAPASFCMC